MRSTNYIPIEAPINLHLEFDQMTVGELSNLLRQWQALLRAAWLESWELGFSGRAPTPRLLVVSASTESSYNILSDIAIPALYFTTSVLGPIVQWPSVGRQAYGYLGSMWRSREKLRSEREESERVFIMGRDMAVFSASVDALRDSVVGPRLERMWDTANGGSVNMTVEVPGVEPEELPPA